MCGIVGILKADSAEPVERSVLESMCRRLVHRGPDDASVYSQGGLGFGHQRLSIIDVAGGRQPLFNEDESVAVIFNGEIYNYQGLRQDLKAKGYRFHTDSDTEVILHLYEDKGVDFVQHLRGMFAIALWDSRKQKLFLVRDRVGIKPLYYASTPRGLVFASELSAIQESGYADKSVDPQAVDAFFAYGYIPSPWSIFRGVQKLEAGAMLTVSRNEGHLTLKKEFYWSLENRPRDSISLDDATEAFYQVLLESVKIHLISERPIGAFLSGGMDSTTVVWAMSRLLDRPIKTFSIGFAHPDYNELPYAKVVADWLKTEHVEEILAEDSYHILPQVVSAHGEPFGDPSSIPTYFLSRHAHRHVTVALSGDGGDELFAGYRRYRSIAREQRVPSFFGVVPLLSQAIGAFAPRESPFYKLTARLGLGVDSQYAVYRCNYTPPMRAKLFSPSLMSRVDFAATERLMFRTPDSFKGAPTIARLQAMDFRGYLVDDVLTKVDRMSMQHSLEVRVPLLDHKVVEFATSLPEHFKINSGGSKVLMRHLLKERALPILQERRKQGFAIPLAAWLRGPLKPQVDAAIESPFFQQSEILNGDYIRKLQRLFFEEKRELSWQIWQLLVFHEWMAQNEKSATLKA